MPINHDMMHAHCPDELDRENATLKEMVAKSQGRIAELENENRELKEKCERRTQTAKMWKNKYEELLK